MLGRDQQRGDRTLTETKAARFAQAASTGNPFGPDTPPVPDGAGYRMTGDGTTVVGATPDALWAIVMDEKRLAAAIPGAETLHRDDNAQGARCYAADVGIGVGRIKGTYRVTAEFAETVAPHATVLFGGAKGPFGVSSGEGWVVFEAVPEGTRVHYRYGILIEGLVSRLGGRLLDAAANTLIDKFFSRLARAIENDPQLQLADQGRG